MLYSLKVHYLRQKLIFLPIYVIENSHKIIYECSTYFLFRNVLHCVKFGLMTKFNRKEIHRYIIPSVFEHYINRINITSIEGTINYYLAFVIEENIIYDCDHLAL